MESYTLCVQLGNWILIIRSTKRTAHWNIFDQWNIHYYTQICTFRSMSLMGNKGKQLDLIIDNELKNFMSLFYFFRNFVFSASNFPYLTFSNFPTCQKKKTLKVFFNETNLFFSLCLFLLFFIKTLNNRPCLKYLMKPTRKFLSYYDLKKKAKLESNEK